MYISIVVSIAFLQQASAILLRLNTVLRQVVNNYCLGRIVINLVDFLSRINQRLRGCNKLVPPMGFEPIYAGLEADA